MLLVNISIICGIYPIDGYESTGIRRLNYLQLILSGEIVARTPITGAQKSIKDIRLNLMNPRGDSLESLPKQDENLQKMLNALFPNLDESYSISLLEISPEKGVRYAQRQQNRLFFPGSVGKLAIAAGLFAELERLYPESFEKRKQLLKTKMVRAGRWAIPNEHTVPFFNPETKTIFKRVVQENDVFSLYEWADHMLSVSSNAAASVLWKELILMRAFGSEYPVSEEKEAEFFKNTDKSKLTDMSVSIVNDPLRKIGISQDEWRLGSMFTGEAKRMVPGSGGSIGSPLGFMKFLVAIERGLIVDPASSLEIKRLLYMTDRRIRYAASGTLVNAAVYYKSGSLYKCKPEEGYECKKYMGNVENNMNSVAIIEHPDGINYLIVLMSNVLRKNSASDHAAIATQIDRIVRKR